MPPNTPEQAKAQLDQGLESVNEATQFLRDDGWDVKYVFEETDEVGDIGYEPITKLVTLE
jgi:hypothetical protein